jgi:DNA-binding GntR family transcriptional regulator
MKPAPKSRPNPRRPAVKAVHGRIRDRLRSALLDRIVSGELKGGDKLNELRLSGELKVSRTPLREALLHLEREGFVRSDVRRGFTVGELSTREVRETYPLIAHLEILAVRNSAPMLPVLIPKLVAVNADFARAKTAQRARDLDTLWHDTLMSQSKNARLRTMVTTLRLAIERYERLYMADTGLVALSVAQHSDIIKHLKRADLEAALKALEHNYMFGMQALLRKMGEE